MVNRDYKNYGGQTIDVLESLNPNAATVLTIFEIASKFGLTVSSFDLIFEGWRSTDSFDKRETPFPALKKTFNKSGAEFAAIKNQYIEIFNLLEAQVLAFLSVSSDEYALDTFAIDANDKKITLVARHKERNNRLTTETVTTEEAFDEAMAEHPDLVAAYFTFAWTFGKANDEFLSKLQPAT